MPLLFVCKEFILICILSAKLVIVEASMDSPFELFVPWNCWPRLPAKPLAAWIRLAIVMKPFCFPCSLACSSGGVWGGEKWGAPWSNGNCGC